MLECYNVSTREEDEDLQKINIPKTEGHCEVQGPQIENPDISVPVKTKRVNIGMEAEPKFVTLSDYQDDMTVDKVDELLMSMRNYSRPSLQI